MASTDEKLAGLYGYNAPAHQQAVLDAQNRLNRIGLERQIQPLVATNQPLQGFNFTYPRQYAPITNYYGRPDLPLEQPHPFLDPVNWATGGLTYGAARGLAALGARQAARNLIMSDRIGTGLDLAEYYGR